MCENLQASVHTLVFLKNIIGSNKNVIIDSGIFKHQLENERGALDISKDIIKICGSEEKEINVDDVIEVFKKMQNQLDEVDDTLFEKLFAKKCYMRYIFDGIGYNRRTKRYQIVWKTE